MAYANINGAQLYYEEHGSGRPIIFHHGYTGSHDGWAEVVGRMCDRYRCINMDGRGAGESNAAPGPNTMEQYAADVCAMADHLGIAKFTYVGLSMGGVIGFELGINHADRLEQLVTVAPAPSGGIPRNDAQLELMKKQWANRDDPALRERMFQERMITSGRPDPEYIRKAVARALSTSEGHYFESWESLVTYNKSDRLPGVTVPTLMVAGAVDGLLPSNIADFQRLGNATLHVFSRVGHGIPYEVPAALSRVLADFFEHGVVTAATKQKELKAAGLGRV